MKKIAKIIRLAAGKPKMFDGGIPTDDVMEMTSMNVDYHLYLITDDEIKEGDWYINILLGEGKLYNKGDNPNKSLPEHKKVIASTDPELGLEIIYSEKEDTNDPLQYDKEIKGNVLPQIPESFIKAYVEAGGINSALVEYEDLEECHNYNGEHIGKDCSCKGGDFRNKLKLTDNNEVVVHLPEVEEKMYSRDEVEELILKAFKSNRNSITRQEDWIEENL